MVRRAVHREASAGEVKPSTPTPPKCRDCGGPNPHVVGRRVVSNAGDVSESHEWLCASCEYKRSHPDAAPNVPLSRERPPKALQKERLFGE
jgi:hypothetical protein